MTALIVIASVGAYLAAMMLTARAWYARIRLLSEPLACTWERSLYLSHKHDSRCYRQSSTSLIGSNTEAATYGLLVGLIWPAFGPWMLAVHLVQSGQKSTLAELEAKNARLERELGMGRPR
jgi:hypothetical protein